MFLPDTGAWEAGGTVVAAARALAGVVSPAELGPHYIIPSVFHPDVASAVAAAVRDAAGGRPSRSSCAKPAPHRRE